MLVVVVRVVSPAAVVWVRSTTRLTLPSGVTLVLTRVTVVDPSSPRVVYKVTRRPTSTPVGMVRLGASV